MKYGVDARSITSSRIGHRKVKEISQIKKTEKKTWRENTSGGEAELTLMKGEVFKIVPYSGEGADPCGKKGLMCLRPQIKETEVELVAAMLNSDSISTQ